MTKSSKQNMVTYQTIRLWNSIFCWWTVTDVE